jgi:hypothetical protein
MPLLLIFSFFSFVETNRSLAYVSGGHEYDLSCNKNGYTLISKGIVVRSIGSGADTNFVREKEKISLGRKCDALHKLYGKGKWCWANGGFLATFSKMEFGFPRQELFCAAAAEFESNCKC